MITMAVVIPITGFLLQKFTTRQVFIAAMSLFSLGTLVAFLSPGFPALVTARAIQASGTAIMMPLLMTTLMTIVPPHQRGRMMGRVSIVMALAPAIGPTMSRSEEHTSELQSLMRTSSAVLCLNKKNQQ